MQNLADPQTRKNLMRVIKTQFPQELHSWFPLRWNMPANYFNPETVLLSLVGQKMLIKEDPSQINKDPTAASWAMMDHVVRGLGSLRIYCIESDLAHDLLRTSPENIILSDLKPPLPIFMMSLPKGALQTHEGSIMHILICMTEGMLAISAQLEAGSHYVFLHPYNKKEFNIAEHLADPITYQQVAYDILGKDSSKEVVDKDQNVLKQASLLAINVLAYMNSQNATKDPADSSGAIKHIRKHTANDRDYATPWVIGRRYASGIKSGSTGRNVRAHWRSGHWRRHACGKGLLNRKLIYIQPVMVGS